MTLKKKWLIDYRTFYIVPIFVFGFIAFFKPMFIDNELSIKEGNIIVIIFFIIYLLFFLIAKEKKN